MTILKPSPTINYSIQKLIAHKCYKTKTYVLLIYYYTSHVLLSYKRSCFADFKAVFFFNVLRMITVSCIIVWFTTHDIYMCISYFFMDEFSLNKSTVLFSLTDNGQHLASESATLSDLFYRVLHLIFRLKYMYIDIMIAPNDSRDSFTCKK